MKKNFRSIMLMLTFLTRIPFPVKFEFKSDDYARGIFFFPLIGGFIGVLILPLAFVWQKIPEIIFPMLVIAYYLLLIGGLHIDGVADVFDGVFSARNRERMLEIMSDSHVGAFGVVGLILYFMGMYVGIFAASGEKTFPIILFSMPVVGRSMGLIGAGISRYAKEEGLGKAVVDEANPLSSGITVVILTFFFWWVAPWLGLSFLLVLFVMMGILYRLHRILEGITGDVLGFLIEVGQVMFLLITSSVLYMM